MEGWKEGRKGSMEEGKVGMKKKGRKGKKETEDERKFDCLLG